MNNLENFFKGWIVGNFEPSLFKNREVEIGIKKYKAGDIEEEHYHKISTEYTIILSGQVKMLGKIFNQNDIVTILPGQKNKFECIEECTILVIKTPSCIGDKYITEV